MAEKPSTYTIKQIAPKTKERLMDRIYSSDLFQRKAEIHGACLKFFTDSREFKDMFEDNFRPMPDNIRPHARLFCIKDGKVKGLSILYEPVSKTVIMKNCNYYGWIKSIGLALVADFFEDFTSEHRRYSVHGSFVDFGGHGLAVIGPSKSGKTTLTYGLLQDNGFNFLTDDWFFVRLTENDTLVYSSEKNSYIGTDLADNWPHYAKKLKGLKRDMMKRAVAEVSHVIGEGRIRPNSTLRLTVLLQRRKDEEPLRKITPEEAVQFMKRNDFCNPHQLIRTNAKMKKRTGFFREFFRRTPVYLLNTIETPEESLGRLKKLIDEIER